MNTQPPPAHAPQLTPDLLAALAVPFPPERVRRRPGRSGSTYAYITARDVIGRLNAVAGPHWSTAYAVVDAHAAAVECRLTVMGVTRADVGYPNSADDGDDAERLKAAYSDSLKRAGVHFGIGAYLYDQPRRQDQGHQQPPPARPQQPQQPRPQAPVRPNPPGHFTPGRPRPQTAPQRR